MTFVFTAHDWPPDTVSVSEDNFHSRSVIIGYDTIEDVTYSAVAQFIEEDDETQFMFALGESHERDGEDFILDSVTANSIIQKSHRRSVMNIFLHISHEMVNAVFPKQFLMATYLPHLPAQALTKYEHFCSMFKACGYAVTHEALPDGHHRWRLNQVV